MNVSPAFQTLKGRSPSKASPWLISVRTGPTTAAMIKARRTMAGRQAVASADVIQLETNSQAPYSVKLWIIGDGPNLYVHAGANRATWVEHMEVDPSVRVLIDGALYELRAQRVTTQTEFDAFSDLYEVKYGRRPRNENVGEAYLFRLLPRSAA